MKRIWTPPDDGLSLMDRFQLALASNRLWVKTSRPIGFLALTTAGFVTVVLTVAAVSALGPPESSASGIKIGITSLQPLPPASINEAVSPEASVVRFDQAISVESTTASLLAWPASGRVTLLDSTRGIEGVTIQVSAEGTVIASARGIVSSLDTSDQGLVTITLAHSSELKTVYGNVAASLVRVGQKVERGQIIGRAAGPARGSPGLLKFRVLAGEQAVDPLAYLPSTNPDPLDAKPAYSICPSRPLIVDPASQVTLSFLPDLIRSYTIRGVAVRATAPYPATPSARIAGPLSVLIDIPPALDSGGVARTTNFTIDMVIGNGVLRRAISCDIVVTAASKMPVVDVALLPPTATPKPPKTATPRDATPIVKKPSLSAPP